MTIPVYVLSGFFESGKTTLLNSCLDQTEKTSTLVLQFELGIVPLRQDVNKLQFTKKMLEKDVPNIVETVVAALNRLDVSELWIEWNCFTEIRVLQEILLKIAVQTQHKLKIEQVVYTAKATTLKSTIQDIGGATIEQLAMSDCLVINGYETYKDKYHLKQIIKEMNSDSKIYPPERFVSNLYNILYKKKVPSSLLLLLSVLAIVVGYMIFVPIAAVLKFPINAFTNIFIGIIFQAIPFLLLGVIISSLIQVFLSEQVIERWFPKNMVGGMFVAIIAGFCLPVCDCATIPIFKRLIRKGVPVPAAITFMIVSPIINPVVILSTMHAFPTANIVVYSRFGLGILLSIVIGLCFSFTKYQQIEKFNGVNFATCNCGCYIGSDLKDTTFSNKLQLFFRHSQTEFFNVAKYIIIGSFVATFAQLVFNKIFLIENTGGFIRLLLIMMVMAFVLSLCSSSDAIIARGFSSSFPLGSILGFLVFGPMIDLKNIFLLSSSFSQKFILKLTLTCFGVCFIGMLLYTQIFLGGW